MNQKELKLSDWFHRDFSVSNKPSSKFERLVLLEKKNSKNQIQNNF